MTYSFPTADWLPSDEAVGLLGWNLADPPQSLDFGRAFLPEALARTAALGFLTADERRALNQIRGNAHLTIMALLDELIGRPWRRGPSAGASLHGERLGRLRSAFVDGFSTACELIGPAPALVRAQAAAPPLARVLLDEQTTWMAKRHVQAAALNVRTLDPGFARLLLTHWIERAPGTAGPSAELHRCAADAPSQIDAAIAGFRRLCAGLSEAMQAQALLDLAALERASGRDLSAEAWEQTLLVQHHAYWWSYIGCGLTHPRFAACVRSLAPGALAEFFGLSAVLG